MGADPKQPVSKRLSKIGWGLAETISLVGAICLIAPDISWWRLVIAGTALIVWRALGHDKILEKIMAIADTLAMPAVISGRYSIDPETGTIDIHMADRPPADQKEQGDGR